MHVAEREAGVGNGGVVELQLGAAPLAVPKASPSVPDIGTGSTERLENGGPNWPAAAGWLWL
jgi:hypothetical protein